MSLHFKLMTDSDFQEVLDKQVKVRVFKDNHIVDASSLIVRFDERLVVTQSGVSDLMYHNRGECEFFELRKR
ncbi:hypothetical protein I6N90_06655 [Paenibacillus sp. GSMTC-2017]|uniref:hypothetical protein n=1 Tax=Paenibacillus sp. GSMTC-2017 TaxID=2794350 RepID=UPI0018D89766|nr:hypothetical protein [Paenibacillus sp. GSMTC-2017]MBH5317495.1 hypothetical protein [Paenibacillus sp. GSMTC-2017]